MKISKLTMFSLTACFLLSALPKETLAEETYYTDDYTGEITYYDESYDDYSGESYNYDTDGTVDYSAAGDSGESSAPASEETYTESGTAESAGSEESEGSEDAEAENSGEDTVEVEPFDPANIVPGEIVTNSIPGWPQGPVINCASAIMIEESTGTVLYASDADHMYYPSGAVKIMTCLLALENSSLDEEVTFTGTGVSGATDGATNIAAQVDETFTMEQCLYAVMLASANDACLQVAEHVGGTVEFFVEMMNDKARELGCNGTLFTNPTGLSDPAQHTTAHDLALIMRAAMENEDFVRIASASTYTIPATNLSGGERNLTNSFTMADPVSGGYYPGCIAGKEGYTDASGSVLVCTAERDGLRLTCAVMRGDSETTDEQAAKLLDYGFTYFKLADLGSRDFSVMEGGTVLVPVDYTSEQVKYTDTLTEDNKFFRQYTYGDEHPIGTAIALIVEEKEDAAIADGEKNMEEALENSKELNIVPLILIIAAGVLLSGFLIYRIVKTAKK